MLLIAGAALLAWTPPASAHPFGPPQTLDIAAKEGSYVATIHWRPGAIDDYSYLAVGLKLVATDRTMRPGALFYVQEDVNTLAASKTFTAYLSTHILMTNGGRRCPGTIGSVQSLIANGVAVTFHCNRPIKTAQLMVSMLTDMHPAYRTLATGPNGQRYVYTLDNRDHSWSFVPTSDGDALARSAITQIGTVLVLIVVAAVGGVVWFRRRAKPVLA